MITEQVNNNTAREEFIRWVLKRNADIPMSEIEFLIGPAPFKHDGDETPCLNS